MLWSGESPPSLPFGSIPFSSRIDADIHSFRSAVISQIAMRMSMQMPRAVVPAIPTQYREVKQYGVLLIEFQLVVPFVADNTPPGSSSRAQQPIQCLVVITANEKLFTV